MKLLETIHSNPLIPNVWPDDSPTPAPDFLSFEEPLKENLWSFGFYSWTKIIESFSTVEQLYAAIQDLYDSIREIKESYRELAGTFPDLKMECNSDRGVSGSYFLIDDKGKRHYIIKPLDEDVGCIHNDGYATPFYSNPLRKNMPLYRSSMREVLAYEVARSIGVSVVPKTSFGIIQSETFHDFSDGIDYREMKRFFEHLDRADKEKLCSVQEYVQNSKELGQALQEFQSQSLSDDEIANRFDQNEFEDANILLWTTYDTDGHSGNFLVYPKGTDEIGNEILGLRKIDNGLAFPEKNQDLRNALSYMPNALRPLSEEGKAKIAAIDVEDLAQKFEEMGLESAVPALRERIPYLQTLAKEPEITLKEINKAISKIGKKS